MRQEPAQKRSPTRHMPIQSVPVQRLQGHGRPAIGSVGETGVTASGTGCEELTGLAQQMCYAVIGNV